MSYLQFFSSLLTLNTRPCIYVGYFTLYIFTAFMFWINAMAANIFFKFSSILSTRNNENENKKFLLYTIYAQVSVQSDGEGIQRGVNWEELLKMFNCSSKSSNRQSQGGYDGRWQQSCKCNFVHFYEEARPPCSLLQRGLAPMLTQL